MNAPSLSGYLLAPMVPGDAPDWADYVLLPEVKRLTSSSCESVADLLPMIERSQSADPNAPRLFSVREAGSGRFVAAIGFHTVSALNRSAEVTYDVRPDCQGRGLATALCEAGVAWGFAEQGWLRIQATTLVEHVASQRVLTKCNFALEGRLRNFRIVRGEPRDYLMFSRIP